MDRSHEVVIIGAGISGLVFAARLSELGIHDIGIYCTAFGAAPYVAAINFALKENPYGDSAQKYADDMMKAGYGISNQPMVMDMCLASFKAYELLEQWEVAFSRNKDGSLKLRQTSGSSIPRSLCSVDGLIGIDIIEKIAKGLRNKGIAINNGYTAVRLIKDNERVIGAVLKDVNGEIHSVYGKAVVAAWGGVGNLVGNSTYPEDIDGAMFGEAFLSGAEMVDMEFWEYEPMIVIDPPGAVGEPCPTAMLAEGAQLLNSHMERFVLESRPEGEAGSSKTLLNKEIWKQINNGKGSPHGGVYADLRHIPEDILKKYPWFYDRLKAAGRDPISELVEVAPMAHSISGGIKVNRNYRSGIDGLYAIGEAAGSLHGACRIGGNAAAQAAVSGVICAEAIAEDIGTAADGYKEKGLYTENLELRNRYLPVIRKYGGEALGAFRCETMLLRSWDAIVQLFLSGELDVDTKTRQNAAVILIMIKAAMERKESRGVHLREDYPQAIKAFERQITITRGNDGLPKVAD